MVLWNRVPNWQKQIQLTHGPGYYVVRTVLAPPAAASSTALDGQLNLGASEVSSQRGWKIETLGQIRIVLFSPAPNIQRKQTERRRRRREL